MTTQIASDGRYFVAPILHDLEEIGWAVVGPDTADHARAEALVQHFLEGIDIVLHAGKRALYAARMHTATLDEGYRELVRKNAELEEAYARLKQLDQLKSNFLGTISHELRTPLTSIIGYSDMLAGGMAGPLNKDQLDFVETIRVRGEQLLKLILSLLDLSKLESGTLRMHPMPVPMEAVVRDALSTMRPVAAKKGVELGLRVEGPSREVRLDPDRIRQVYVNLLDNAVKFTPRGGRVDVALREVEAPTEEGLGFALLAPARRELEVRVSDTGVGIPAHERARVFDAFYQIDQSSTREQGGAGLGLAIVKRLVEAHQGRIRVEGAEPVGTTFVLNFPLPSGHPT
jgi:two-component system sensor histidine kinase BarA